MAEAVAGLLASAFVSIAKDKLGSAIAEQASLLWNFGGDLEDMKDVLETISAVLEDAERRSAKEKRVQLLLKRLKHVALDISDVLEDYQETSDQATAKKPGVLSCIPSAYKKIAIANRMKSLRKELMKIKMEFASFAFISTESTTRTNGQLYDKFETTSYFSPEIEGREGEKQEIINLLQATSNHDERETVIVPIYALGGMGKTTLAQLVYNDDQLKKQYDCHIWVYVSQDFNLLKIGNSIISQVLAEGAQQNRDLQNRGLQVIMGFLENLLNNKKVLIVLDDLWEKDDTELSKLKNMLHVGKKGSMIDAIVTTRDEEIARKVSTSKLYKLHPLKDDVCWEIIKRSSNSNQKKFECIGLDIAKKCGGLPLAAQALGYMLQSKDISEWKNINDSDIWHETSDGVLPSLRLSYQRMPQQLRICFSYCAIFSKGQNIVENDLIHQWSVLGFIDTSKGKEYIKHLLGMSFLQVSKMPSTSQGRVVRYTMHDLVHDLARLTMEDELLIFDVAPPRNTHVHKYCRYSLLRKYDRTKNLANMPSKLRALRFSDSGELDIPSGALSFVKCLRTLDFSECSGIMLPASIGRLKQLRCLIAPRMENDSLPKCITELSKLQYLNINGSSKITVLPESIGNLWCLKYLGISGCSGISKLPESFGDLKCMVHLDMSGCSGLTELPDSLGNLTHLQHLELSGCSSVKAVPESIGKLGCLKYLCLSGCSAISKLVESFGDLKCLVHLDISGCSGLRELPDSLGGLMDLQYLNMSGCWQIGELPESMMKLQNLLHIDLSSCFGLSSKIRSGKIGLQKLYLTNLKYLALSDLNIWLTVGSTSYVADWIGGLTNLEHLDLSKNPLECLPASIGNLKRLHTLDLSDCRMLRSLPESIRALHGLKSIVLHGCSHVLVDQASSLVHFSHLLPDFVVRADDVNGCSNLPLLEGAINVSELRISSLENVRSPEEAKKVKLLEKQNLSELSLAWKRMFWEGAVRPVEDKDVLGQLVPPRGLKHMRLQGYSSAGFPGWLMDISCRLTNLVSVELCDLPTCGNLPPLGQLPHLEKLSLWMSGIKRIDREFCGGKGAFRRLLALEIKWMSGLEEWHTTYSVEDGVEEFMFPVLDRLEIEHCPRLRFKPCPPTFRECFIGWSDQVLSLLEEQEDDQSSHPCCFPSRAIKLDMEIAGGSLTFDSCQQSTRLFHYFPNLRELRIRGYGNSWKLFRQTSLPDSMQHLTSLESLTLEWCNGISALPEWLGDLSSLNSLVIKGCSSMDSLPSCIQHLAKLQKIEIWGCEKLKKWCELEENKAKLAHINVVCADFELIDWSHANGKSAL